MKACVICGSPFEVGPHTRKRKYCSDACSDKAQAPGRQEGRAACHAWQAARGTTRMCFGANPALCMAGTRQGTQGAPDAHSAMVR